MKSERERQIYDFAYMWHLKKKKDTNELIFRIETHNIENKFVLTKGEGGETKEFGINIYTLHYIK